MAGMIKAVVIDFGGVIAEEGFREGLMAIARRNGLAPDDFFAAGDRIIDETGYLTGMADEQTFWGALKRETGIAGSDSELRQEVLRRFVIRDAMLASADFLRTRGHLTALLSDQTNWLEEIDCKTGLFRHFDEIFNSLRTHKNKRDPTVFRDICAVLNVRPDETLFVDDNPGHIGRAACRGLNVLLFQSIESFQREITRLVPAAS